MTVFDYADFREFMRHRLLDAGSTPGGRRPTLRGIAHGLGYASPSLLSMVLSGKRFPSDEMCEGLVRHWNLPLREREYFRLLIALEKVRADGEDPTPIIQQMRQVAGKREIVVLDDATFSAISSWHCYVIQQLIDTPDFQEDPAWISRALRRKISPTEARSAIEKMEKAGLIVRDRETGRLRSAVGGTETTHDVPSAAIRKFHAEMIDRAKETLEDRPVKDRLFNALTFRVSQHRVEELRDLVWDFMREVNEEFSDDESNSVYQVCVQLFEHTSNGGSSGGERQ